MRSVVLSLITTMPVKVSTYTELGEQAAAVDPGLLITRLEPLLVRFITASSQHTLTNAPSLLVTFPVNRTNFG